MRFSSMPKHFQSRSAASTREVHMETAIRCAGMRSEIQRVLAPIVALSKVVVHTYMVHNSELFAIDRGNRKDKESSAAGSSDREYLEQHKTGWGLTL
jgi:hypothetical protein